MSSIVLIIGGVLLSGTVGIIIFLLRQSHQLRLIEVSATERLAARDAELAKLHERHDKALLDNESLKAESQSYREETVELNTRLELERKQFEDKLVFSDTSKEQLGIAFKNIANEIFDDKSKKLVSKNQESLSIILNPLQEKIKQFEKRVEETYDKESKERFSLANEIKNLQELNIRISEDAVNLTNALKGDNKAQGNWGEFVLESILEKSGLLKGREYDVQVSLKAEDGSRSMPDVIVHLPESRDIIIDSKVSLKAWDAYCSNDDTEEKAELLKRHIQSVRLHVKSLSAKDYQKLLGINSLDYVFLFMPIEAAYTIASQNDPELAQYAFEKNIIFVGPTMLIATLKLAQNLWRLDQQNQNANEIARKAGDLYDKFVGFVDSLDDIGTKIDSSKKSFDRAHKQLISGKGNLVRKVEVIKQLGAKTSKKLKPDVLSKALRSDQATIAVDKPETENPDDSTRH